MKPFLRILLPAAVCGLLLGACTQRQTTLKFMSYNIRNGRGIDNVQDLGRVAEIINRTAPDIVALQELDSVTGRMAGRFIPGELGEMTGMHARFCRAIDYDGGAYGVGLLSRDEPLAVRRIPLPGREESRVLFVAEFPDYVVCVTHLSLTPEDQRASLPIIRTVTDTCRKPVLLAGDFNMKVAKTVLDGLGDVAGAKQASFSANGFQGSYTLANPSGTAYFDRDTLKAFLRSLGRSQRVGSVMPSYGGLR